MIRLLCFAVLFFAQATCHAFTPDQTISTVHENHRGNQRAMFIQVQAGNKKTTVFQLNDSTAAKELYAQLPLTIAVENYSNNEKIFYPPRKLGTSNTPLADATAGTLAYFAPWGDVVMFYGHFGSYKGLYELGEAVSGSEHISQMSGTIQVEKK